MYIKIIDGTPKSYTLRQLRADYPQTSFPERPSDEVLAHYGVYTVKESPKPAYDSRVHYLRQSEFYQVGDEWRVHWTPERLPNAGKNVREERDRLLSQSDWTQLADAQVDKSAWAAYRQALRDIPAQPGFPFEVVWPVKP